MEAAHTYDPVVTVQELADLLGQVTVLDVRYRMGGPPGREEYEAGHVPGAVHVDLDSVLASPPGAGGRHPLPRAEEFQDAMRAVGVSSERGVVVYDDWQGRAAARAWWLLRHHGHPDVRVLDGGWAAWRAAGLGAESGSARVLRAGTFTASPQPQMPVVEADGVPGVEVLLDARAPERYRGEVEPVDPVAGHVPGARNLPTELNLDAQGRFRSPAELRETYAAVGAVAGADVAVYCGSGVTAAHDVLALERAGVRAALYPGSWSGWVMDPSRPVELG